MNIALFADSRWRDSFGLAVTKLELQNAIPKANVWVIPFDLWQQALDYLNPDVAVLNHLFGSRNKRIAAHVKRNKGKVYVMPTEGRPDRNKPLDFIASQKDSVYLDMFFSWNDIVASEMDNHAIVTGSPRFQIYQEPYRQLVESRGFFCEKYNLDKNKRIVGVTTNFPQAKFHLKNQAFNRQDWQDIGISEKIDRLSSPDDYAESEYRTLEWMKGWIYALAAEYQRVVQVVLKPHPLEDVSMWQNFCDMAGVTLVRGEYIQNFVNASDIVVVREDCMTAQDAWLTGTPTIHCVFDPNYEDDLPAMLWSTSTTEFLDDIEFSLFESPDLPEIGKDQKEYLSRFGFTQEDSASRVAEYIKNNLPEQAREKTYNYPAMLSALKEYDAQHYVPHDDYLGHYGKHVTMKVIEEWERGIRGLS